MKLRLRDIFYVKGEIQRGGYLTWGLILFSIKYILDRFISLVFFQKRWFITDYFIQADRLSVKNLSDNDILFYATLVTISIPFIWFGTILCLKRLRNTGLPLWLVIFFFIPMLNFIMFLILALLPENILSRESEAPAERQSFLSRIIPMNRIGNIVLSIGIIVFISLILTIFSANFLKQYGWSLFVGVPFFLGFGSVLLYTYHKPRTYAESIKVTMFSVIAFAVFLLVLAIEGFLCIFMAMPLGLILAWIGGSVGYLIQSQKSANSATMLFCLSLFIPLLSIMENESKPTPTLLRVSSQVIINANSEVVWENLIDFSEIKPPEEILFKLGIAYPINARIIGNGNHATRFCIFNTGEFVEPIQIWEKPKLLRFLVQSQPEPLRELTPYKNLNVPHLDEYFISTEGQFELTEVDANTTILEGTTWYKQDIWPGIYWKLWANYIIHKIHFRVLNHIMIESEKY